jgi:hypothetical protein
MPKRGSWRGSLPPSTNVDAGTKEARLSLPAVAVGTVNYQVFEDVYDMVAFNITLTGGPALNATVKLQGGVTTTDPYAMINYVNNPTALPSTTPYGEQSFGGSPYPAIGWVDIAGATGTVNLTSSLSQSFLFSIYPVCYNMINIVLITTSGVGTWFAYMSRKCSGGNN